MAHRGVRRAEPSTEGRQTRLQDFVNEANDFFSFVSVVPSNDDIYKTVGQMRVEHRTYYLPIRAAGIAAPLYENLCLRTGRPLYFTPDAVEVLASENKFCRDAALTALGYSPRSLESSVRDTVRWLLPRPPTGPRNNSH